MSDNIQVEAERTLLGAILLDPRLIYECGSVRAEWFALSAHREIFSAMQRLDSSGKLIDTVTLASELGNKLEPVGGYVALSDLINGSIERQNVAGWVEIIGDAAKRRHLAALCQNLLLQVDNRANNTNDLLDTAESRILTLRASGAVSKVSHVRTVAPVVLNEICAQMKRKDELVGLSVGIDSIDYATTGIRPGEYWVVGGAPSRGKTVLGGQMVATSARAGVPVLVFSYEMTKEQLVKRMLPRLSGVPACRVRDFRYGSDAQYEAIQKATDEILTWPMWVCDPDGMSADEMCTTAKFYIRRHGVRLVVVDYLQIINAGGQDIRARVGASSNALRSLAKAEGIGVVALSQLRRPADEADRPTMFALKESGDIEAHAHTVLLLYRPKDESGQWSGRDEVIIAKQREGVVGTELVTLDSRILWFVPRTENEAVGE